MKTSSRSSKANKKGVRAPVAKDEDKDKKERDKN
jgi:hypothetical protein